MNLKITTCLALSVVLTALLQPVDMLQIVDDDFGPGRRTANPHPCRFFFGWRATENRAGHNHQ